MLSLDLPDSQSLKILHRIHEGTSDSAIVVMTGEVEGNRALQALRAGAQDCLNMGAIISAAILQVVRYAFERMQAELRAHHSPQILELKGTGHGLSIAHSVIVDKHGGRITVESEVDQGSSFIVEIPLDPGRHP